MCVPLATIFAQYCEFSVNITINNNKRIPSYFVFLNTPSYETSIECLERIVKYIYTKLCICIHLNKTLLKRQYDVLEVSLWTKKITLLCKSVLQTLKGARTQTIGFKCTYLKI